MVSLLLAFISMQLPFNHVQGRDGCRELDFLHCTKNKALTNRTIASFQLLFPGLEECQHKCFMNDACVSYNLGPVNGVIRSCELSDTDHVLNHDLLVEKEAFEYCAIMNPCTTNTCPDNTFCKPDFSFFECKVCKHPLGMESGEIPDSAITASSAYDAGRAPYLARLHNVPPSSPDPYNAGVWVAGIQESGQYLQIDLGRIVEITMVATQGRADMEMWTTMYSIAYSKDGMQWLDYQENGQVKAFTGNEDSNTVVVNRFKEGLQVCYVRIVALGWRSYISIRAELYTCR